MDLHMRLLRAQRERASQKLFGVFKPALIFADQAQKLQPIRLVRIGGKHARQNLVGLLPAAMPDEIRGLQNRCGNETGRAFLHGRSIYGRTHHGRP